MNEVLINPMVFYLVELCGTLRTVFSIASAFAIVSLFCFVVGIFYNADLAPSCKENREYLRICQKGAKITVPILLATLVLFVVIPSTNTAIAMIASKYVTQANVDAAIEGLKSVVDYIVTAIKGA